MKGPTAALALLALGSAAAAADGSLVVMGSSPPRWQFALLECGRPYEVVERLSSFRSLSRLEIGLRDPAAPTTPTLSSRLLDEVPREGDVFTVPADACVTESDRVLGAKVWYRAEMTDAGGLVLVIREQATAGPSPAADPWRAFLGPQTRPAQGTARIDGRSHEEREAPYLRTWRCRSYDQMAIATTLRLRPGRVEIDGVYYVQDKTANMSCRGTTRLNDDGLVASVDCHVTQDWNVVTTSALTMTFRLAPGPTLESAYMTCEAR